MNINVKNYGLTMTGKQVEAFMVPRYTRQISLSPFKH